MNKIQQSLLTVYRSNRSGKNDNVRYVVARDLYFLYEGSSEVEKEEYRKWYEEILKGTVMRSWDYPEVDKHFIAALRTPILDIIIECDLINVIALLEKEYHAVVSDSRWCIEDSIWRMEILATLIKMGRDEYETCAQSEIDGINQIEQLYKADILLPALYEKNPEKFIDVFMGFLKNRLVVNHGYRSLFLGGYRQLLESDQKIYNETLNAIMKSDIPEKEETIRMLMQKS